MQSAVNIPGKVFEKGAGELDIKNALMAPIYAMVDHVNTYGVAVSNDRWELVVTPYTTSYANITIVNGFQYDSGYNFTFNISIENITSMEYNNRVLNASQLSIVSAVNVTSGLNTTLYVNFTLSNFSATYATTYGGIILLSGTGNNGTNTVNKTIRIPVVITIPIMNQGYITRKMYNPRTYNYEASAFYSPYSIPFHEDVFSYCYYSSNPRNVTFQINWTYKASDDMDLFLHNSSGDFDACANNGFDPLCTGISTSTSEMVSTTKSDNFKWFRIDGYNFSSPITFDINITETGNTLPELVSVIPINGSINSTYTLIFYRPNNLILNISYYDADGDDITVSVNDSEVNDSEYTVIENNSAPGTGYVIFSKNYTSSMPRNSTLSITLQDSYGAIVTQSINILLYTSIRVNTYSPYSNYVAVRQNGSQQFTLDVSDMNNNTLYYYWSINGTLNDTPQNFTFNTSGRNSGNHTVDVLISNNATSNETNETLSWTVYIDGISPSISILHPAVSTYNHSRMDINYSSTDASDISSCWYSLNGTLTANMTIVQYENITLDGCTNNFTYLVNGQYTLNIYSNDTVGNTGQASVSFNMNDTTAPIISDPLPISTQAYTTTVTLAVTTNENATCKYDLADIDYDNMSGTFSDMNTAHSYSSYSVSTGGHTLFVRCRDISNNTNNESTSIVFTISDPPAETPSTRRSSGGGSGTSYYYDPDSDMISEVFGTLEEGETNVSVENEDIPVSQLTIYSDLPLNNVTINLSKPTQPDVEYSEGEVSSYLELVGENIPVDVTLFTKIFFSVTFEWLNKTNITRNDVVLLLYNYDTLKWEELLTAWLNEDNNTIYYVAESPKFGLFAISSNETRSKSGTPITPELEENETINKTVASQVAVIQGIEPSASGNSDSGLYDKITNAVTQNSENILWIVWALCGTFVIAVTSMVSIRNSGRQDYAKVYKRELLVETKKEFQNSEDVLVEKVPSMPVKISEIPTNIRELPTKIREIPNTVRELPAKIREIPSEIRGIPASIRERFADRLNTELSKSINKKKESPDKKEKDSIDKKVDKKDYSTNKKSDINGKNKKENK